MAAKKKFAVSGASMQAWAGEDALREMVRTLMQELMTEEVEAHLGARRHERTEGRRGHRNGYKGRHFKTRVGDLALEIPQVRGMDPYHPSLFERYERTERALLVACGEMYFLGVSTRKVARILETMMGGAVSAATVSRVAQELDEQIAQFRARRLDEYAYPYLIVDARYEKVRRQGRVVSTALLVVAGVRADGRREVLTWAVGDSESEATWGSVFQDLKRRGVHGVHLLVSDAHAGIRAAASKYLQGVAWQRCRVHLMRELVSSTGSRHQKALAADLRGVFAWGEKGLCRQAAQEFCATWAAKAPKAVARLEAGLEDCLAVLDLPEAHRRRLHSTNLLERMMEELKRRTRVVGIFPNEASLDRLGGALLMEMDERWQLEPQRYVVFEEGGHK
jgi:transposase-like protein